MREHEALPFFTDGYRRNSSMNLGHAEYGLALASSGRLVDALDVLENYRHSHGSYPVNFIRAYLQIKAGRDVAAYNSIVSAIAWMKKAEYHDDHSQTLATALKNVMHFCKCKGYEKEYSELDNSPLLTKLRQDGTL